MPSSANEGTIANRDPSTPTEVVNNSETRDVAEYEKAMKLKDKFTNLLTSEGYFSREYGNNSILFERMNENGDREIVANFQFFPKNYAQITLHSDLTDLQESLLALIRENDVFSTMAFVPDSLPVGEYKGAFSIKINTDIPREFLEINAEPVNGILPVTQNGFIITNSNDPSFDNVEKLATWGAGPCKIIIITQKNPDGSVTTAMAHDQNNYISSQIEKILALGGFDEEQINISVLSQNGVGPMEKPVLRNRFPQLQIGSSSSASVNIRTGEITPSFDPIQAGIANDSNISDRMQDYAVESGIMINHTPGSEGS